MTNGGFPSSSVQLAAIVLVALALVPAGAHFFEMPNKMGLDPDRYMTVQSIYTGWALFGIVIYAALAATLAHAYVVRREPRALALSLGAFLCIAATQVIFWTYTYPMNAASKSWTVMPQPFEAARRQWEYSHAVNAGITLLALFLIVAAVLASRRAPR